MVSLVIGGGVSGLTAAYYLARGGREVILVEKGKIGGVVQTSRTDGFTLEHGPNVFVGKPHLLSLLAEVGLGSATIPPSLPAYNRHIWTKGKLQIVPNSPFRFLTTGLIPFPDKLRILQNLYSSATMRPRREDESVEQFLTRIVGSEAVYHLIEPALLGIYGGEVGQLSARSIFPEFWQHICIGEPLLSYFKKSGGAQRPRLFMLRGGNATLIDALVHHLRKSVDLHRGNVEAIRSVGRRYAAIVQGEGGKRVIEADEVFIATSGSTTASYLNPLAPEVSRRVSRIRYAPLVVFHCAIPKTTPLPDRSFGVLFSRSSGSSILGVMCNSLLFPHTAPSDEHLLTVCVGGVLQNELTQLDDAELTMRVKADLQRFLRIAPDQCRVLATTRWPRAIPQYEVGHQRVEDTLQKVEHLHPGLYFTGADRDGVGVSDRVRCAYTVVDRALALGTQDQSRIRAAMGYR